MKLAHSLLKQPARKLAVYKDKAWGSGMASPKQRWRWWFTGGGRETFRQHAHLFTDVIPLLADKGDALRDIAVLEFVKDLP